MNTAAIISQCAARQALTISSDVVYKTTKALAFRFSKGPILQINARCSAEHITSLDDEQMAGNDSVQKINALSTVHPTGETSFHVRLTRAMIHTYLIPDDLCPTYEKVQCGDCDLESFPALYRSCVLGEHMLNNFHHAIADARSLYAIRQGFMLLLNAHTIDTAPLAFHVHRRVRGGRVRVLVASQSINGIHTQLISCSDSSKLRQQRLLRRARPALGGHSIRRYPAFPAHVFDEHNNMVSFPLCEYDQRDWS